METNFFLWDVITIALSDFPRLFTQDIAGACGEPDGSDSLSGSLMPVTGMGISFAG
jgi:hypothetical protein